MIRRAATIFFLTGLVMSAGLFAASVWYSFTPDEDVILVVVTIGPEFPLRVGVYLADELRNLVPVACPISGRSGFAATAGRTYFFQLGSVAEAFSSTRTGHLKFSLDSLPIPSCSPPQFSFPDPVGDVASPHFEFPDITAVNGGFGEDNLCVTVEFLEQVDPPDAGTEAAVFVRLVFDTDKNPSTGDDLTTTYQLSCGTDPDLGIEMSVNISGYYGALVPL